MIVLSGKNVCYFDVDDTLVEWVDPNNPRVEHGEWFSFEDEPNHVFFPIRGNIEKLISLKTAGSVIVVWSQGGAEWGARIVRALGLEDKVDLCVTKPDVFFDDLPPELWLTNRMYFGPDWLRR